MSCKEVSPPHLNSDFCPWSWKVKHIGKVIRGSHSRNWEWPCFSSCLLHGGFPGTIWSHCNWKGFKNIITSTWFQNPNRQRLRKEHGKLEASTLARSSSQKNVCKAECKVHVCSLSTWGMEERGISLMPLVTKELETSLGYMWSCPPPPTPHPTHTNMSKNIKKIKLMHFYLGTLAHIFYSPSFSGGWGRKLAHLSQWV